MAIDNIAAVIVRFVLMEWAVCISTEMGANLSHVRRIIPEFRAMPGISSGT